jgi:ComF family protein
LIAAGESLFASLFPGNCRLCNAPLARIRRIPVCEVCQQAIHSLEGSVCSICGERLLGEPAPERRCLECIRFARPFARAVAYGSYEGELRALIHLLKYQRVRPAAAVLGRMLAESVAGLLEESTDGSAVVIPIPLHRAKQRQRGFNQTELIARAMVEHLYVPGLKLEVSVLRRCRMTESQTGLTRSQRRRNVRGAFTIQNPGTIAGRDILLVDDVFTTGTTVSECARLLRRAGAARVWVATVARVIKREAIFIQVREQPAMKSEPAELRAAAEA